MSGQRSTLGQDANHHLSRWLGHASITPTLVYLELRQHRAHRNSLLTALSL